MTHQVSLPLADIDVDLVKRQPSMRAAIQLSVQLSGKDPKAVYIDLGIDKSHWSKIMNGQQAYFPDSKYEALAEVTGNDVPLIWYADRRNYTLKRKLSAVEAENQRLREEVEDSRKREALLMEALRR